MYKIINNVLFTYSETHQVITQNITQQVSNYDKYDVRVQASLPPAPGRVELTTYGVYNDTSGRSCST